MKDFCFLDSVYRLLNSLWYKYEPVEAACVCVLLIYFSFFDVADCVWMFLCEETTNGEITAVLEQRKRAGFKK